MKRSAVVRRGAVLAIVLVSYTMIVLDISIVITALPKIHRSLGFSETSLSWVQNAYLLAFGGLLLLGARAGDLLGRRRIFILGLALFTIASIGVGTAQSELWLIAARAVQGIGAAILAPTTLALLQTTFPAGQERTRAVAYYAAVAGVASTVGLVVGGMFAGWLSRRAGFFINAPIGVLMILATLRYVPEAPSRPGSADAAGAASSTLGMTALVFGIVHAGDAGWTNTLALAAIADGAALLAGFVLIEQRAAAPIMPLRLFHSRERTRRVCGPLLVPGRDGAVLSRSSPQPILTNCTALACWPTASPWRSLPARGCSRSPSWPHSSLADAACSLWPRAPRQRHRTRGCITQAAPTARATHNRPDHEGAATWSSVI